MHSMLEHLMNGFQVQPGVMSQEMLSAVNFLAQHPGCKVFRTEWAIYAPKKDVAGSIDLVLRCPESDTYILVDWKRSEKLRDKDSSFGRTMAPLLQNFPDCHWLHVCGVCLLAF